ncbi:Uncharacterised protein [Helicobacter fennelliae]|uniref:Uncharacterized protein n=2 Tax=Helicobacter fennelliae TaxID=215 RepID=T1D4B4_9HELI|nr:hypothetical protein HFN_1290 [Helicobacter fennelliae MRY12-0050]SQB98223.1 Uncharacterised protein [Helicobacter fennelliae]STP07759.1 Uncharacterised protein [Helicobacter fennelliae]STQ84557.1 Uncharacterised protein [Helicobacter fennelliae]
MILDFLLYVMISIMQRISAVVWDMAVVSFKFKISKNLKKLCVIYYKSYLI